MANDFLDIIRPLIESHVVAILIIIVIAYLAGKFLLVIISHVIRRAIRKSRFKTSKDEQQREDTLIAILRTGLQVAVWTIATLMILSEIGINIGPLLAGAGIVGVALGFGAQSMVKDFLAGIFIITENQYRVGDVLQINQGVAGIVEDISLRATTLRDLDGVVHFVPNGHIEIATNMTMEYAQVDLNIRVSYASDIDHVEAVINKVGEGIFADEAWKDIALEAPYMMRVDEFTESAIVVKIVCKTAPIQQWNVKSEILKRIKTAFDKEGIIIPYPQHVIHEAKPPNKT